VLRERRGEKGPELPEDDRQGDHERRPEADPDRGRERLDRAEGRRLLQVVRQRPVQPVEDVAVEDVGDDEGDQDRPEHDEEPGPKLAQVLDERRLLAVAKPARQQPHGLVRGRLAVVCRRRRNLGLVVLAADRVLELAHAAPERAAHLREPLRAEHEQRDDQDDHQARDTDLRHGTSLACSGRFGANSGLARLSGMALLEIKNLHVSHEETGKEIVKGVDLAVDLDEVHAVMGPNGSGKSTLAYALMGHPAYEITEGEVLFDGENLVELEADERAQRGLFLAFQYPHAVPGVTVTNFLRSSINSVRKARAGKDDPIPIPEFRKELLGKMEELKVTRELASRYINDGFSGGDRKKKEMLQLAMMKPRM